MLVRPVDNCLVRSNLIPENRFLSLPVVDLEIIVSGDIVLVHELFYRRSLVPARVIGLISSEMDQIRPELRVHLIENVVHSLIGLVHRRIELPEDRILAEEHCVR